MTKCKATKTDGGKCPYDACLFGYCMRHYQYFIYKKKEEVKKDDNTI